MSKRELVKSAIQHIETEKLPFCIQLAEDAEKKYSKQLFERYAAPSVKKLLADGVISFDESVRMGIGNSVIDITCPWWSWYDLPNLYKKDINVPSFLPKTIGRGSYESFIGKVKMLREQTDCYILVCIYGSHFEKANSARGIENFLADMAGEPEYASRLLNKIIDKNMVMLENIIGIEEIDGILLGSDWGTQQSLLMSPKTWRELIAPGEKKEYDLIKSENKDVWIHSCGRIDPLIPDLINMGIDVLNPIQPECMDIYDIKKSYGDKLSFWGGISTQQTLPYGTPAEVASETMKTAEIMRKGGGYILSPSQSLQSDVPFDNICSLIDTAKML